MAKIAFDFEFWMVIYFHWKQHFLRPANYLKFELMDFTGKWSIEGTDETLKILATSREEQFLFEYSGSARKDEKVNLFMSNERYALLTASKVFGRADVFILSKDTFLINDVKLVRMPMV